MFDEEMIHGKELKTGFTAEGVPEVTFGLRLPWYRSLWLSCVERIDLKLDGVDVPVGDISFTLYGKTYPFAELLREYDVLWFILDVGQLHVKVPSPLPQGEHQVAVMLYVRLPYRKGSTFTEIGVSSKTMTVAEGGAA